MDVMSGCPKPLRGRVSRRNRPPMPGRRRNAAVLTRRELFVVAIGRKAIDRDYRIKCAEKLCAELTRGRRRLLVDRIPLARQAGGAFADTSGCLSLQRVAPRSCLRPEQAHWNCKPPDHDGGVPLPVAGPF